MTITISLDPETEAKLKAKAMYQGQDISILAAELIKQSLDMEQDTEEAIAGIQRGLDDFISASSSRSGKW